MNVVMKNKRSCYLCQERTVSCHDTCPKYKEFQLENQRLNQEIQKQKLQEAAYRGFKIESIKKSTNSRYGVVGQP